MISKQFCPAKINLFLEVTGKRPNGYHELATLFAKLTLGDYLTVTAEAAAQTRIQLHITGPLGDKLAADENNIAYKAAARFFEQYGITADCKIELEKHIPMGAGLGGGSSDGAGVLRALCQIFNKPRQEVMELAAKLGADVPVFMYDETFLKGEGIGEILTPVPAPGPLPYVVLVYPCTVVPTKDVFKRLQLPNEKEVLTNCSNLYKLITYIGCGKGLSTWKKFLFNRLETCVFPYVGSVRSAREDICKTNAEAVLMSGSGSTVFALVETKEEANDLVNNIRNKERLVFFSAFRRETDENNGNTDTSYGGGPS